MNLLHTPRLTLMETAHTRKTMHGPVRCVCFNAWMRDGLDSLYPSILVAAGLLVDAGDGRTWSLSHLLVEDEARRHGFGTEIVRFYEDRQGPRLGACWVSDAGVAFARRYVERFGPRPAWEICEPGEVTRGAEAMFEAMRKGRGG